MWRCSYRGRRLRATRQATPRGAYPFYPLSSRTTFGRFLLLPTDCLRCRYRIRETNLPFYLRNLKRRAGSVFHCNNCCIFVVIYGRSSGGRPILVAERLAAVAANVIFVCNCAKDGVVLCVLRRSMSASSSMKMSFCQSTSLSYTSLLFSSTSVPALTRASSLPSSPVSNSIKNGVDVRRACISPT